MHLELGKLVKKIFLFSKRCIIMGNCDINGSMPEWLMGADCKSAGYAYAGSNPARPTTIEN